jgi:hypothetical protein
MMCNVYYQSILVSIPLSPVEEMGILTQVWPWISGEDYIDLFAGAA